MLSVVVPKNVTWLQHELQNAPQHAAPWTMHGCGPMRDGLAITPKPALHAVTFSQANHYTPEGTEDAHQELHACKPHQ